MKKQKQESHLSLLIGVFILVILLAGIIFVLQFRSQAGEAARFSINTRGTQSTFNALGADSRQIVAIDATTTPDFGKMTEPEKRGILVNPGYDIKGLEIETINEMDIIIIDEDKPKLVLYDPKFHGPIVDKIRREQKPYIPTLEELGRVKYSPDGKYTCYYDENGKFVRAWRVTEYGFVEINEDPDGKHKCPKKTNVKEPPLPKPVVSKENTITGDYVDINTLNMQTGGMYNCYYDKEGNFVQAMKSYANHDIIVTKVQPYQCPDSYMG